MRVTTVIRPRTKDPIYRGLLQTARNGAAIFVDVKDGPERLREQARARAWAKRRGFVLHYASEEGGIVMWLEGKGRHEDFNDTTEVGTQEEAVGPGIDSGLRAPEHAGD